MYTNNLYGDLVSHDNINFNITENTQSKGIVWSGLTDRHSIYVEELASGTETTRLVIHSADNVDSDGLVIRQSSAVVTKDVIDVKYSKVTVNAGTLTNKGALEIESSTATSGCRQVFNNSTGTLMFVFY
jgi:hypothetical protein